MTVRGILWALVALWLAIVPTALRAVPVAVETAVLRQRSDVLLRLLKGKDLPADLFTPAFLAEVPETKVRDIASTLQKQFGKPRSVSRLDRKGPAGAVLSIRYQRAEVLFQLALEVDAPHRISGLLVAGSLAPEKTLARAVAAVKRLPGTKSLALTRLDDGQRLAAIGPDRTLAAGSVFKLIILAEISRAVQAGEMRWDDRAAIDISPTSKRSAPVRELAEKMISVSDNAAADSLAAFIGRERLEAMMGRMGIGDPGRNRPFLSVVELFKLKSTAGASLGDRWTLASEDERRQLLDNDVAALPVSAIEQRLFQDGRPIRIDTVEWFFTADDLVRMMDWFRQEGDAEARRILAINPGIGPVIARDFTYVGYKGGSEPGVLAINLLIQDKGGHWYALAVLWNDRKRAVNEARLTALVSRMVMLLNR